MPLVTVFNIRKEDDLRAIEQVIVGALASMPELAINDWEIDVVPVVRAGGSDGAITRINVDLWERPERSKQALQELASRVAEGFRSVAGAERHVKVVIRPYDIGTAGWYRLDAVPPRDRTTEERLPGGNLGGAVRVGDTVRRRVGPWTSSVGALLAHLEERGFRGAPRYLGIDEDEREVLTFIEGETVGDSKPWPEWVYATDTLDQVADWLRAFHEAVADFTPPSDAVWRFGQHWQDQLVVGHNDAAPYNAVWRDGRLVAFIDWEFAAPVTREWDLAYVAFSWVPLHARDVVEAEGFTDFAARPARLRRMLRRYGWGGDPEAFVEIVRERARSMADGLRRLADAGDDDAIRLVEQGHADTCERASAELADFEV